MARLTTLEDVLFVVGEHPVFARYEVDGPGRQIPVPGKKALVNEKTHRVLGIVSRDYRLVSNSEALDLALKCCQTVFPETRPVEWEATAVDAPSTAGYCHIDLTHNSTALDFSFVPPKQRPEAFGPFIRVTNSYNGCRALGFDIGFFRKVCKNGMILPDTIISFKFNHMRGDIGAAIRFEIAKDRLTKFKSAFTGALTGLRECSVPLSQFESLIFNALQLRPPSSENHVPKDIAEWNGLKSHVAAMSQRYADELGENAYAIFNVITDFASRPPSNRFLHRERHGLQRLAGSWLTSFNAACRSANFSTTRYVEEMEKAQSNAIAFSPQQIRSRDQQALVVAH